MNNFGLGSLKFWILYFSRIKFQALVKMFFNLLEILLQNIDQVLIYYFDKSLITMTNEGLTVLQ